MSKNRESDLASTTPELNERQRRVMERIDRRVPIKIIAQDLGVSETRINQHIRAIKDIYEVYSLNELVEKYRSGLGSSQPMDETLSESACNKNQLQNPLMLGEASERDDPGHIVISDVLPIGGDANWELDADPRVVPGLLDGEHAVLLRLGVIVGIAFGILAAVVLMVTAAMAISDAMEGVAQIPVEDQLPSG